MRSIQILLVVFSAIAFALGGAAKSTFRGEISDTQCAMNVHSLSRSHAEMIARNTLAKDPASCAKTCVGRGGEWVLRSGDDVFRLKNQAGLEHFAAEEVRVVGVLDSRSNTIDNTDIEPLQDQKHTPK